MDKIEGFYNNKVGVVSLNIEVKGRNMSIKVGYADKESQEKSVIYVYDINGFNHAVIFEDLTGFDFETNYFNPTKYTELREEKVSIEEPSKRIKDLIIKLINRKRKE